MDKVETVTQADKKEDNGLGQNTVIIFVDGKEAKIHRGRRTVAEIKVAGSVPLADELSQVIDKKITPLADDGSVVIKGDEVFVSNRRSGGSS